MWGEHWQAANYVHSNETYEVFRKLRGELLSQPHRAERIAKLKSMVNVASVRTEAMRFKRSTTIGTNPVGFREIAKTCDEALDALVNIIHKSIEELALPSQAMVNAMTLLGKKTGGARTIAVCTTIYRLIVSLVKSEVREWDSMVGMQRDRLEST